jgi:hypothetical protein
VDGVTSGAARALRSLLEAAGALDRTAERAALAEARQRGYFTPAEEEGLIAWFARLLTVRSALWEVIGELSAALPKDLGTIASREEWRGFVLGYAAACGVVRLDRLLVEDVATDSLVQRKLNEGSLERRVPRKQFTVVYESLTHPRNALAMNETMQVVAANRETIEQMADDEQVGFAVRELASLEAVLDPSVRRYLEQLVDFGVHALRRRGASAKQQVAFAALESGGRLVSEIRDPTHVKRMGAGELDELRRLLRPGDVLVTRHERALTNLFLPGYWPHAALFVGTTADRERMGVDVDPERCARWSGECCVLEALKDGVLFRPLEETLAVDAVAVLRPRLTEAEIADGLARAVRHEGKPYNFDFDFLRSDRLVCTEVVYRAYDGLGDVRFALHERAGRPTLSAEDLLDVALGDGPLDAVALFGAPSNPSELLVGDAVAPALAASYR